MGYSTPAKTEKLASIHRMMIQGPSDSGKTSAVCRTWPQSPERKLYILEAPGERGDATIPRDHPSIAPYLWTADPMAKLSSSAVIQAVETVVWEILGEKYGAVESFCFDGFHKHYDYILDDSSNGQLFRGEKIGDPADPYVAASIYNRARKRASQFVQKVNASPVPNIVWTCWDGREADDPSKGFKGQSHIYPNLPGAAAKEFMGEFGLVVHSRILWGQRDPAYLKTAPGRRIAKWQIQPDGDVWGASVKAPLEVIDRLPMYCEQSYPVLATILADAWAASRAEGKK